MRLLKTQYISGTGWKKRLEWLEIDGLRGWEGQRVEFNFPMVAICGENGSGKSTILQSAACVYYQKGNQKDWYVPDFFPETHWDKFPRAEIRSMIRHGDKGSIIGSLRKFPDRWRGYDKRELRDVKVVDLGRIQPIYSRTGFSRLAKTSVKETSSTALDMTTVGRLSEIMGRKYQTGKMAITDADADRQVPVISMNGTAFSGFHQGAGEFNVTELIGQQISKGSLLLIDEVETSLHPRAQRRLIRDLASVCRNLEIQIILTTHSPYVLEEFPPEARCYILQTGGKKMVVFGVSPEFAMTQMDDDVYPECDLYVEDEIAKAFLREIIACHAPDLLSRVQIVPFGSTGVGVSLGMMAKQKRFPRRSLVLMDGDAPVAEGCNYLPGGDAPERIVFTDLKKIKWSLLGMRSNRGESVIDDACSRAMTLGDHHHWVKTAAQEAKLGSDTLWHMMASTWSSECLQKEIASAITDSIRAVLASPWP